MKIKIGEQVVETGNIPAGNYNVGISSVEEGAWKSGKKYLKIIYVVLDGPQEGRKINDNITLSLENIANVDKFSRQNFKMTQYADHFLNAELIGQEIEVDFGADADGSWRVFADTLREVLAVDMPKVVEVSWTKGKTEEVPAMDVNGMPIPGGVDKKTWPDNMNVKIITPAVPTTV